MEQGRNVKANALFALTTMSILGLASIGAGRDVERRAGAERDQEVSPVQRRRAPNTSERDRPGGAESPGHPGANGPAHFPGEFRTIDGVGNNPIDPLRGSSNIPFLRLVPQAYGDGVGDVPARVDGSSARLVSNLLCDQPIPMLNQLGASDFLWQWGQFLDHDITETPLADPSEPFDIAVPLGDPEFDPFSTGVETIGFDRSSYSTGTGVREQLNEITAFIDASNVYGSDELRAAELRTLDGTGRLRTSAGDLLPFNVNGFANAPTSNDPSFFLAGDIRANEQVGLTAMHTIFVREHNHIAGEVAQMHPEFSGDDIYEHARAIVGAQMQAITYNEFLPFLLGPEALPPYMGYQPEVDPGIGNVFASSAYRFGHSMLSAEMLRIDADGSESAEGHLALSDAFFVPQQIIDNGVDSVLRGLAAQRAQAIDAQIIDEVRNLLFGPPGAGGLDLAALNVQRGRDHGLPSYNVVRVAYGLPAADSFEDISPDPAVQAALDAAYESVDDVDPWIGVLCEPHTGPALIGETLRRELAEQFAALRDGDRFWYRSYLPPEMVAMVEQQTLARIIRRNTGIGDELAANVFLVDPTCPGDFNGDGDVGVNDLISVLDRWGPCPLCAEDMNGDQLVDVIDVLQLIQYWGACE